MMFIDLFPTSLLQGLILGVIALGVMIPFKLLNLPDLTAEGAYPLGGAVCASLLLINANPVTATLLASLAGGIMGMGTAWVHLRFKVNSLLAGIILSTMIYSINLRLLGKPNVALFEQSTLFSSFSSFLSLKIVFLLIINAGILLGLLLFLRTEKGLRFRAVGLNPGFAQKQGIPLASYVTLGLFAGSALTSCAGSLMVQMQEYADIGMGVGIVIHALAALMIGESLIGANTTFKQIMAPFIGALIYQQIQGLALSLGFAPSDLKLLTGAIVLVAISYKHFALKEVRD